jgi:hypothetical protein
MRKALPKGKNTPHIGRPGVELYSYFQALYLSFYSAKLYVDVNQRWRGLGFRYLLILSVLFSIPWGITEYLKQYYFYTETAIPALEHIPTMKVHNGRVVLDKKMPFLIKNPRGKAIIVIDTREKSNELDNKVYPDAIYIITKNSFISYNPGLPPHTDKISKEANGTVDSAVFLKALNEGKKIFLYSLYPLLVSSLFSALIVFSLLFGFIGRYFSKSVLKYSLTYRDSIKLTTVAMTPVITLLFIFYLTNMMESYTSLLLFFILLAYYTFAVRANKHRAKSLVVS